MTTRSGYSERSTVWRLTRAIGGSYARASGTAAPREWRGPESNRRHHGFQPCALPTELPRRTGPAMLAAHFRCRARQALYDLAPAATGGQLLRPAERSGGEALALRGIGEHDAQPVGQLTGVARR